jgi:hypothetical protein
MTQPEYSRDNLIEICERAFVPQSHWSNRDTSGAQKQLGECYALLRAGCGFRIIRGSDLRTDDRTIWLEVESQGFAHFDYDGGEDYDTYYLPTPERLESSGPGNDWY